jgi:hypothetical protein
MKKKKVGCPPKNRDCKMKRVMVQEPLVKTVKQMVKEYDEQSKLKQDEH